MECKFQPVSGPVQAYDGAINTVGIDTWELVAAVDSPRQCLAPQAEYPTAPLRGNTSGLLATSVGSGSWGQRAGRWFESQRRSATCIARRFDGGERCGRPIAAKIAPCANVTVILAADAIYFLEAARLSGMLKCGGLARREARC